MKVLIVCEESGKIRDAFIKAGHDAWSCDIKAGRGENHEKHYHGDALELLSRTSWDLLIAHPPCTYLTCSAEWAYNEKPMINGKPRKMNPKTLIGGERSQAREDALNFVRSIMACNIEKIAIENPRGVISTRIDALKYGFKTSKATQYIQPHQYGHDASKTTGLWLKNLDDLQPTKDIKPRIVNGLKRWANQTDSGQNKLAPSEDRAAIRSETYQGWADAMADQWGKI